MMSGHEKYGSRSQLQRAVTLRLTLASFGLALGLVAVTVPVAAQRYERRDFWGRPLPSEPPRADRSNNDLDDREAAKLYAEAQAGMDQGQHQDAQRKLEILVARFPASPLVTVARRDLAKIYAAVTAPVSKMVPMIGGIAPVATQIPSPQRQTDSAPIQVATPAPMRSPNEEFRLEAGDRVFFSEGSADLGSRARTALESQAAWLTRFGRVQIVLEGHADERGTRDFNKQIAAKRAEAVRDRLVALGVTADRIKTVAYGRERPIADCTEQNCAQQNRLVVTVVSALPQGGDGRGDQARSN